MFKRIKEWRQRRIEQKLKKRKERNGKIISSVLGIDKISDEGFNVAMRLDGHKYKTAMQCLSDFEEKRRKLGLEALLEARRISAEFHNPEGVLFSDVQRPEGYILKTEKEQSSLFCVKEYELENYIKELREEKGLSTKQLAQVFGMSEQAFSYIERGAAAPTIKLAYLIAAFFGKSVQEVFVLRRDGRTFCGEAMERTNEAP